MLDVGYGKENAHEEYKKRRSEKDTQLIVVNAVVALEVTPTFCILLCSILVVGIKPYNI